MVSNVSAGKKAEARFKRIMHSLGYMLVAEAKGRPVWKAGRVVGAQGDTDLVKNSVDQVWRKKGSRIVYVQVCHSGGESPRRAKLRAVDWDPLHEEPILAAWDIQVNAFRLYRHLDDFLVGDGWYIGEGDHSLPWDAPTRQVVLP